MSSYAGDQSIHTKSDTTAVPDVLHGGCCDQWAKSWYDRLLMHGKQSVYYINSETPPQDRISRFET